MHIQTSQQHTTALAKQLGMLLLERQLSISCAESCTGGGIAYAITSVAGSSAWFNQSWVTYSNLAKQQQLAVCQERLDRYGAVSEQIAMAMLEGVLSLSEADIGISVTGIAGPTGGAPDKPVGLVWFGFSANGEQAIISQQFYGNRSQIRQQAIDFALAFLIERLVE
jgi:nicotinamide-nucleotide amidase